VFVLNHGFLRLISKRFPSILKPTADKISLHCDAFFARIAFISGVDIHVIEHVSEEQNEISS